MMNKEQFIELLLNGTDENLEAALQYTYPTDILDIINQDLTDNQIEFVLNRLPADLIAELLDEEDEEDKYELLLKVSKNKHREVLDEMSSDELADLIENIDDKGEADAILESLSDENKDEVRQLLTYEPDTAGGIMATEYINVFSNKTVRMVFEYLQEIKDEVESAYALYVTDKNYTLKGVLTLSDLATSSFDTPIIDIMNPNVISVHFDEDQENVAELFDKYNLLVLPVVDYDNHILGIVTFDDIIEILKQEATEDIHQMGGIASSENADSTAEETIRSRLPWLIVNLFTAIFASSIVNLFSGTIQQVVALAALMPIVTGMGGNVGSQTLTFTVRSLAINEIDESNAKDVLKREMQAAIFNGIVIAFLVFLVGWLIGHSIVLGVIVGVAMLCNVLIAALIGYLIPLLLKKLNIDPALASSVLVTTATDSFGFLIFLGLATIFIELLI